MEHVEQAARGREAEQEVEIREAQIAVEREGLGAAARVGPGSQVHGYFLLDDKEIAFRGWVAWAIPGNPMASVFSQIGVRFNEVPEGLKAVFQKLEKRPRRLKKK